MVAALLVFLPILGWTYWNTLVPLVRIWTLDPQYSHGYLVPIFALVLLLFRRDRLAGQQLQPSWWAIPFVLGGILLRLAGAYYYLTWLDHVSLLPILCGFCLAIGGRPILNWAWPGIAFLMFMIPLPGRLQSVLSDPLQRIATIGSTNVVQTLGFFAQSEGNVILLSNTELGVVDACKGLHMLVVFFALSTGVAILTPRAWYQRLLIVASAIPIALSCNIIRITATAILYETTNEGLADWVFHDVAGWLMIPLALAFLGLEFWILSRLFVPKTELATAAWGPERLNPRRSPALRDEPPLTNGVSARPAGALTGNS
jgi:exosortase